MKNVFAFCSLFLVATIISNQAWALVPPDYQEPPSNFNAEVEAGLQLNTGNNESKNFNGRSYLTYDTPKTRQEGTFKMYYSADGTTTTAEKYDVYLQTAYKLNKGYVFGRGEFTWDDFGSFTEITTLSTGYGFDLIKTYKTKLSLEAGPGYRYDMPRATVSEPIPEANREVILRTAARYSVKLQEYTSLNADVTAETGLKNNTLTLDMSYKNTFLQDWAFKIGMNIRYTQDVPQDSLSTDTTTTFNLLYTFQ
jgi:putative salt-induced outer membrane protein